MSISWTGVTLKIDRLGLTSSGYPRRTIFKNIHNILKRHVQRRPPEAPVRSGVLKRVDKVKRGRGRPKLTWDESVKRDLKD